MNVISQKKDEWGVWVLVVILVVILVVRLRSDGNNLEATPDKVVETTPVEELNDVTVMTDEEMLKASVLKRVDMHEGQVDYLVEENTGVYAKGSVKEIGVESDSYWLAVKDGDKWIVVYDGEDKPPCKDVNVHEFPVSMVSECMDVLGEVTVR